MLNSSFLNKKLNDKQYICNIVKLQLDLTSPKRWYTTEKNIQYDACTPNIYFFSITTTQYLGSNIVSTANHIMIYLP